MSRSIISSTTLRRLSAAHTELYNANGLEVYAVRGGRFEIKCGSTNTVAHSLTEVSAKIDELPLHGFAGSGAEVCADIKKRLGSQYRLEIRAADAGDEKILHEVRGSKTHIIETLAGTLPLKVADMVPGKRYALQTNMYGNGYAVLMPLSEVGIPELSPSFEEPVMWEPQPFAKGMMLHGLDPATGEVVNVFVDEAYPNGTFKDRDGRIWSSADVEMFQLSIAEKPDVSDYQEPDTSLFESDDLPTYNPTGDAAESAPMLNDLVNYDNILNASASIISDFMKTAKGAAYLDRSSLNKISVSAINAEGQATDGSIEWNVRIGSPSYKRSSQILIPMIMKDGSIELGKEFIISTGQRFPLTAEGLKQHLGCLADDPFCQRQASVFPSTIHADADVDALMDGVEKTASYEEWVEELGDTGERVPLTKAEFESLSNKLGHPPTVKEAWAWKGYEGDPSEASKTTTSEVRNRTEPAKVFDVAAAKKTVYEFEVVRSKSASKTAAPSKSVLPATEPTQNQHKEDLSGDAAKPSDVSAAKKTASDFNAEEVAESYINGNGSWVKKQIGGDIGKYTEVMNILKEWGEDEESVRMFQRRMQSAKKTASDEVNPGESWSDVVMQQDAIEVSETPEEAVQALKDMGYESTFVPEGSDRPETIEECVDRIWDLYKDPGNVEAAKKTAAVDEYPVGVIVKPLRDRKRPESSWVAGFGRGKTYKVRDHDELDGEDLLVLETGPDEDDYALVYADEVVKVASRKTAALTISKVEGENNLYSKYPGQSNPQPAYMEIDPEDRRVHCDYSGEIGNAVPMSVYHDIIIRVGIPPLKANAANAFMRECADLIERVCDGHTVEWNGNNNVGVLNDDAKEALEEIESKVQDLDEEDMIQAWDAIDYWDAVTYKRDYGYEIDGVGEIRSNTGDDELNAMEKKMYEIADDDGVFVDKVSNYLEDLREQSPEPDDDESEIPGKSASKKTSSFMQPYVQPGKFVIVDGPYGGETIAADLIGDDEIAAMQKEFEETDGVDLSKYEAKMYFENNELYDIDVEEGWVAYLSAPGYMDRTENTFFKTQEEAEAFLREEYPEAFEDEGDEGVEASKKTAEKTVASNTVTAESAKELTESQKEEFSKVFYDLWDNNFVEDPDFDSGSPWGAPWVWGGDTEFVGSTVEEMAKNFFDSVKDEIRGLLKEEADLKGEVEASKKTADADATTSTYNADAEDLVDYIANDEPLYRRMVEMYKNLTRKKQKGTYDSALAPKLFRYITDEAAKKWYTDTVQWADVPGDVVNKVPTSVRQEAAEAMAESFESAYDGREYDFMGDAKDSNKSASRKTASYDEAQTIDELRKLVAEEYELDPESDVIRSLGKFEDEHISSLFYYDAMLNGDGKLLYGDEYGGGSATLFDVSAEAQKLFDTDKKYFVMEESNDGFIYGEFVDTPPEIDDPEDDPEDEDEDEDDDELNPSPSQRELEDLGQQRLPLASKRVAGMQTRTGSLRSRGYYDIPEPGTYEANVNDLLVLVDNERRLYDRMIYAYKNLTKKKHNGTYDSALAPKIFKSIVDDAAKVWYSRIKNWADTPGDVVNQVSTTTRQQAAEEMAKLFERAFDLKEYDFMDKPTAASLKTATKYEVSVGNIGNIEAADEAEARATFDKYVRQSESGIGRAGGESVYLLEDGEPIDEHIGATDLEDDDVYGSKKTAAEEGKKLSSWNETEIIDGEVDYILEGDNPEHYALEQVAEDHDIETEEVLKNPDQYRDELWEIVAQDRDLFEMQWEGEKEYLTELIKERVADDYAIWDASGQNMGWRNLSGAKTTKIEDADELIKELFPKTSQFSFDIYEAAPNGLRIVVYHHDSPTGETYEIFPVKMPIDQEVVMVSGDRDGQKGTVVDIDASVPDSVGYYIKFEDGNVEDVGAGDFKLVTEAPKTSTVKKRMKTEKLDHGVSIGNKNIEDLIALYKNGKINMEDDALVYFWGDGSSDSYEQALAGWAQNCIEERQILTASL